MKSVVVINKAEVAAERLRDEERLMGLARVREANRLHLPRWRCLWAVGLYRNNALVTLLPLSTGGISRFPSQGAAELVAAQLGAPTPISSWRAVRLNFATRCVDNVAAMWRWLTRRRSTL